MAKKSTSTKTADTRENKSIQDLVESAVARIDGAMYSSFRCEEPGKSINLARGLLGVAEAGWEIARSNDRIADALYEVASAVSSGSGPCVTGALMDLVDAVKSNRE